LKEQTLDVQDFSAEVLMKKETHAVVYTRKNIQFPVFSECSKPHPTGLQAPSIF
jgi:hypothetical protein